MPELDAATWELGLIAWTASLGASLMLSVHLW